MNRIFCGVVIFFTIMCECVFCAPTEIVQSMSKDGDGLNSVMLVQWDISNFDKLMDAEIPFAMATIVQNADIVIFRKINPGPSGTRALTDLIGAMNNRKVKWDYITNNHTEKGVERFAFAYRIGKVKIDKEISKQTINTTKNRPWGAIPCRIGQKSLTIVHAFSQKTFSGIRDGDDFFARLSCVEGIAQHPIVVIGDFNSTDRASMQIIENNLGFTRHIEDDPLIQKKKKGDVLIHGLENIFTRDIDVHRSMIGDFTVYFSDVKRARNVGEYLPTCITFSL